MSITKVMVCGANAAINAAFIEKFEASVRRNSRPRPQRSLERLSEMKATLVECVKASVDGERREKSRCLAF